MGKKVGAVIFHIIGYFIIAAEVIICLPISIPKLLGYEEYSIVSGSMEPEIPVNSLVYVDSIEPEEVAVGDIIAFYEESGDVETVVTHRVVENKTVEGEFITKGDANDEQDMEPRPYGNLIGIVKFHFPLLGLVAGLLNTLIGKIYAFLILICGFLFILVGGKMKNAPAQKTSV